MFELRCEKRDVRPHSYMFTTKMSSRAGGLLKSDIDSRMTTTRRPK